MSVEWMPGRLILLAAIGGAIVGVSLPGEAQEKAANLLERDRPATTVKEWIAQAEAAIVRVTGVRVDRTDQGLQVVLVTESGQILQATQQVDGNTLVLTVPNAVLALSNGQAFEAEKPVEGIDRVSVTQADATTIRISITGLSDLPTAAIVPGQGLVLAVTPEEGIEEEVTVTGEGQDSYRVTNSSVGTRTDTPLRDIPASIQIVPRQVLEDQNILRLEDALRNVPGTSLNSPPYFSNSLPVIRGFVDFSASAFINGIRNPSANFSRDLSNVEQIEVLKGPASVLLGQGEPGGIINIVTKQPLRNPLYKIEATLGSYDFYRGAIDLSGPLDPSKSTLYRLNIAYRDRKAFIDFLESRNLQIAPVLSWNIGERTKLTLEGEYTKSDESFFAGQPALGGLLSNPNGRIPRNRNYNQPSDSLDRTLGSAGYRLEHQFSDSWSIRNAFQFSSYRNDQSTFQLTRLNSDNRTLNRRLLEANDDDKFFSLVTDITGKFSTGSINHQLLVGLELSRYDRKPIRVIRSASPIDLFNPLYDGSLGATTFRSENRTLTDTLGIYVQNQVALSDNLKLLLGGRFDTVKQTDENRLTDTNLSESSNAFSPRLGIVYQPVPSVSLYASYSRSFNPVSGTAFDQRRFDPERGTQYEIGIKTNLTDRFTATLAYYDLTRSNVLTDDPVNPGFSIQTGEQKSRGVELSLAGEVAPGWKIIAGYAYTNAKITQDNVLPVGNRLDNVPENSFNLWTTYEIQQGDLRGLGIGLGLFFAGERQGDLDNSFQLPSYLRTDAAIFYQRDRFRAALNFRNLFNVNYFENAFGSLRVYPGEPLTVQGTISWQL